MQLQVLSCIKRKKQKINDEMKGRVRNGTLFLTYGKISKERKITMNVREEGRKILLKVYEKMMGKYEKMKAVLTMMLFVLYTVPVRAAGSSDVINQINNMYNLVTGIIAAMGAIVLAWGGFEFGAAYQERDSAQQTQALRKIVGGLIMMGIGGIIAVIKG